MTPCRELERVLQEVSPRKPRLRGCESQTTGNGEGGAAQEQHNLGVEPQGCGKGGGTQYLALFLKL